MIIVSLLFFGLCFYSTKIKKNLFSSDLYLGGYSIHNTSALKGILALGIILCHITSRVDYHIPIVSFSVLGSIGVGIFFFLSGYSLVVSSKKNPCYFNYFLYKRGAKIMIPFTGMMILWIIIVCGGTGYPLYAIIKSWIKGYPVSNSWYVFASIYCYILFWMAFYKLNKKKENKKGIVIVTIGLITYIYMTAIVFQWGDWWYKTIECFLIGILWGVYSPNIQKLIRKQYSLFLFILLGFSGVSYLFPSIWRRIFPVQGEYVWFINDALMGFSFTLLIAVLLYKIDICNRVTLFLGNISYEIYLLHGVVMAVLDSLGKQFWNLHIEQEIYAILICTITIVAATLFHNVNKRILNKILKNIS